MLTANNIPEFLWEYAVLHAAYLRNRSYTKHLPDTTPYEGWFDKKPDVAHLREFGAPVWILLQGQKEQRKMLSNIITLKHAKFLPLETSVILPLLTILHLLNLLYSHPICRVRG